MKFYRKYWNLYFVFAAAVIMIGDVIYWEIRFHYIEVYNGIVIEKQQIPPKKMPELLIKGNDETFPMWKWEGVDFDSIKLGDST